MEVTWCFFVLEELGFKVDGLGVLALQPCHLLALDTFRRDTAKAGKATKPSNQVQL